MKALNDVVEKGWVRYIGASSMAAWEFQTLQNIAEKNGWHKFIRYALHKSLMHFQVTANVRPVCRTTTT